MTTMEETFAAYALPQPQERLRLTTWTTLIDDDFPGVRDRDVGKGLTPEQLGALAYVVDRFADAHLGAKAKAAGVKI